MRLHRRVIRAAILVSLLSLLPAVAVAQTFNAASTGTLLQTADLSAANLQTDQVNLSGITGPLGIPAAPASFQLANTFTDGTSPNTSTTTADAGLYEITTAHDLASGLKAGTGVNQTNPPGDIFTGFSDLKISVNYAWNIGSSGYPTSGGANSLLYQYNIGGNVDEGGSDAFIVSLTYALAGAVPTTVGTININQTYTTPGAFSQLFSASTQINGGRVLPPNSTLTLTGSIEFKAKDPSLLSNIYLTDEGVNSIGDGSTLGVQIGVPEPASGMLIFVVGAAMIARRPRGISL